MIANIEIEIDISEIYNVLNVILDKSFCKIKIMLDNRLNALMFIKVYSELLDQVLLVLDSYSLIINDVTLSFLLGSI